MTADVAVLIPTLRRPESLARALRSVFAQAAESPRLREVVVADNDPAASARDTVEALRAEAGVPLIYVHAPKPGVATARNAGLAATDAPLIGFLDDDEEARPGWLAGLLRVQAECDADVVFGPIRGRVPDEAGWARDWLELFFSREGPRVSGPVERTWGCGASLMRRATALPGPTPFDPDTDQTGGEDDVLFAALKARGARFAWAADAWAVEHPPAARATLRYALVRSFAYGQGPSQTCAAAGDWAGVARWTLIGAGQAAVFGLAAAALFLLRRPERAAFYGRVAEGLGKVLWMKGFEPRLYGSAGLTTASA